jgi:hypothetical protein
MSEDELFGDQGGLLLLLMLLLGHDHVLDDRVGLRPAVHGRPGRALALAVVM